MALGDHSRVQNAIDYQGNLAQNHLNNLRDIFVPQNQNIWNRYQVAADRGASDYNDIMGGYNSYLNSPGINFNNVNYNPSNQSFGAYGGYQNFADTGGYLPQNIQDIRARSVAPLRATYANAQSNIDRQRSLQGGYSPNYTAATAKLSRDLGYGLSDQATNIEAMLADAIRNGKLAGLQGMTGIDTSRMGEGLANAQQNLNAQNINSTGNLNAQNLNNQRQLQALSGMTSAYGTAPGMASMYGNQLNQSNNNLTQTQQLQQQLMQAIMNGTLGMSNVPGNYQQYIGNISDTVGLAGNIMSLGTLGALNGGNGVSGIPGGQRGPF